MNLEKYRLLFCINYNINYLKYLIVLYFSEDLPELYRHVGMYL